VPYQLFISQEAREQIRALPNELRKSIGYRLHRMQHEFGGDIKKLEGSKSHYRLRIGKHRILFRVESNNIEVYAVRGRGKMPMSEHSEQEGAPTIQQLAAEMASLRERVEDLEDARELDAAIRRNGDKPLIPWDQVRPELGLSDSGTPIE
jgi:mRNA interferase RelE/StbE